MPENETEPTPAPIEQVTPDVIDVASAPMTFQTLKAISRTTMVPAAFRGKPYEMFACILAGRELGMGPMESLRRIDVIDGKPSPSAEWMIGRVVEAGHLIYPTKQTETECVVEGVRREHGKEIARSQFRFTIAMARRANLANKTNWKNYPEAMLYWRAASQLCRQFFPDVLGGMKYLAEELGADEWAPEIVTSDDDTTWVQPEAVDVNEIIDIRPDPEVEIEQWATLLALLEEKPDAGTMKDIEARVRQLYAILPACVPADLLDPDIDWFHTHLEMHYAVQHWGDLRVRANMEKFARRAWGWAKQLVEDTDQTEEEEEDDDDDTDGY